MDSRDEEIYRKHADELIRFATTLVGAGSAEDVFSGAILKAMSSHSWPSVTEYRAYLAKHKKKPLYYRGREKWSEIPKHFL